MSDQRDRILAHAQRVAQKAFDKKGNHFEVHMSKADLAVWITAALITWESAEAELGRQETEAMIARMK